MEINDKISKFSLKFQDKELEKEYLKWHFTGSLKAMRNGCFYAVFLLTFFSIPDFSLTEHNKLFLILRFGILIPLIIAGAISTYFRLFEKYGQFIFSSLSYLAGVFLLYEAYSELPKYSIHFLGFGILILAIYYLLELRLVYAAVPTISLFITFLLAGFWQPHFINSQIIYELFKSYGFFYFTLILVGFFGSYSQEKLKRQSFIQQNKIAELLHNVLPIQIVKEYNEHGFSKPVLKNNATIIFTDFVSFSKFAEGASPQIVVDNLDRIFSKFDDIVKSKNLEKLKTIGDSYVFAGGLFSGSNQLEESLEACFEMVDYIGKGKKEFIEATGYDWTMRIGIHIGSVVTGLIGKWRFLYDTWGNTVNIASRLEGASETNRINTSKEVFELLNKSNKYNFEYRGSLPIKNMNPIEMYFVELKK